MFPFCFDVFIPRALDSVTVSLSLPPKRQGETPLKQQIKSKQLTNVVPAAKAVNLKWKWKHQCKADGHRGANWYFQEDLFTSILFTCTYWCKIQRTLKRRYWIRIFWILSCLFCPQGCTKTLQNIADSKLLSSTCVVTYALWVNTNTFVKSSFIRL